MDEQTNTEVSEPMSSDTVAYTRPKESPILDPRTHMGPILGVLIILLVIILGGLYLWGSMLNNEAVSETQVFSIPNNEPETPRAVVDQEIMTTTSSSDSLEAIEADIEGTNLDNLDTELNTLDQEISTEIGN